MGLNSIISVSRLSRNSLHVMQRVKTVIRTRKNSLDNP